MKVHLRKRKMRFKKGTSKPRYSLYLDIYYRKGKRKREFLGIYLEPIDLNELKAQTGLSNKKWEIAIKGLRKHNLVKVEKTEEGLFVELV